MQNPIKNVKSPDGTYELSYFGKVVGWTKKARYPTRPNVTLYRAVSVHGEIRHCYSLKSAKSALLEMYH